MTNSSLIILLVILIVIYLLLKNSDPYQDFKKWLDNNPQQKNKLDEGIWNTFFTDPEMEDIRPKIWEIAIAKKPVPDNLLEDNKIVVALIRKYLSEKEGVRVKSYTPPKLLT